MDTPEVLIARIQADAASLAAQLAPVVPVTVIATPTALDAALAAAVGGETFTLSSTLVYPTAITISKSVTLQNATPLAGRATLAAPMPSFSAGLTTAADHVSLIGIEIKQTNPLTDIVVLGGAHQVMDGCRVLGDPVNGAKRGIAGNAADVTIIRCYVEDCFGPTPGDDTQAFAAWDSPGPFLLQDNYFSGGSETVLFGGADPSSVANVPQNIHITGNTITKRPGWQTLKMPNGCPVNVKNVLELKNAMNVLIDTNDISECWGGNGQDGYLLMLTPRNQGGTAPYSCVKNVTIQNNTFHSAAGAIAMLGTDNDEPSGPLDTVRVLNNTFTGLDPWAYTGADKMIEVLSNPANITISGNTFAGVHIGSALYFGGPGQCVNFAFTNNVCPTSTYGVMGAATSPDTSLNNAAGLTWTTFVASGSLQNNTVTS